MVNSSWDLASSCVCGPNLNGVHRSIAKLRSERERLWRVALLKGFFLGLFCLKASRYAVSHKPGAQ